MTLFFEAFHFLRPIWLGLVPVVVVLWWRVRRTRATREALPAAIAPHLRNALTVGRMTRRKAQPIDGVAIALICLAIAAAGPTWSRDPDPFAAQAAPVVVVLKVAPSMEADDIAPSRLERGKQKIRDLLELRAGARTALVAYSGSAHIALPMTEDAAIMQPYLAGLSPEVMPAEGNAAGQALALAETLLATEPAPGGILFVTDGVDPADSAALSSASQSLAVLAMLPEGMADRGLDALSVPVVPATPDARDVREIDALLNTAFQRAMLNDASQPWNDRAHWLAWPAGLLVLLWFRRGWTMRWAAVLALAWGLATPHTARADGLADWFFTPDQQGQRAFEDRDFARAADLFTDPLRRGYAQYRAGQYEAAVEVLDRVDTAQAAMIQGLAHIKSRSYRDGVRAFETALERDPDYPGAAENLATAQRIVTFIETTQEQSDTGEEQGIGADDIVFDNESDKGADTQLEVAEEGTGSGLLSADQWMATVDTRTEDFLRQRFALEASQPDATPESARSAE
ncbi:VWA domain-containing protein [Tropicimonas sp. S265A]|uniref:VWA domain-containing protein n=1 Tax=Tropicimonas sp. S265A TaxID=3415134 RepID=UPI003C7C089F